MRQRRQPAQGSHQAASLVPTARSVGNPGPPKPAGAATKQRRCSVATGEIELAGGEG